MSCTVGNGNSTAGCGVSYTIGAGCSTGADTGSIVKGDGLLTALSSFAHSPAMSLTSLSKPPPLVSDSVEAGAAGSTIGAVVVVVVDVEAASAFLISYLIVG